MVSNSLLPRFGLSPPWIMVGFVGCVSLRRGIGYLRRRNCTLGVAAILQRYTASPNGWVNLACDHTVPASSSSSSELPWPRARFLVTFLLPNTVSVMSPQIVPVLYLWATLYSHQRSLRTDSCLSKTIHYRQMNASEFGFKLEG